ncbi:MAG TPA: methyltransferase domain-containing protein, partial [Mycobacterium sp.]|nr:methyltransferase domain-containing protein [Mycobacterium sp.]
ARRLLTAWQEPTEWLNIPQGGIALDVGCGPGNVTASLARAAGPGGLALGVDVSGPMLARAVRAEAGPQVGFLRADAQRLPLRDKTVDAVDGLAQTGDYKHSTFNANSRTTENTVQFGVSGYRPAATNNRPADRRRRNQPAPSPLRCRVGRGLVGRPSAGHPNRPGGQASAVSITSNLSTAMNSPWLLIDDSSSAIN